MRKQAIAHAISLLALLVLSPAADAGERWFASGYIGKFSDNALVSIIGGSTQFEESYVYVGSIGRELGAYNRNISMEWAAQAATHTGDQSHAELNGVFTVRWHPFPWDRHLDTNVALGNGLSYASEPPPLEERESDENETSKLLYYVLVELAFAPPGGSDWEGFIRTHHRSSVFGAINDVHAGSNYVGGGVRHYFR